MPKSTPFLVDSNQSWSEFLRLDALDLALDGVRFIRRHDAASTLFVAATPKSWSPRCPHCGCEGVFRRHKIRRVVDIPCNQDQVRLELKVPVLLCVNQLCTSNTFTPAIAAAARNVTYSTRCGEYIVGQLRSNMSIKTIAATMGLTWHTVNTIAKDTAATLRDMLARTPRVVRCLAVDEHCWRHKRRDKKGCYQERFNTVIYDITGPTDGTGPAVIIAIEQGRSQKAFARWIRRQEPEFLQEIEVVSMDGFNAYAKAVRENIPHAVVSMDPFHVAKLYSEALDRFRRSEHQRIYGHRGRKGEGLFPLRRVLLANKKTLSFRARWKLDKALKEQENGAVFATLRHALCWCTAAYAAPDSSDGQAIMEKLMDWLNNAHNAQHPALKTLRTTMNRRRDDILAHFTTGVSNGPAESLNARIKCLRRIGHGFRNSHNYEYRIFLQSGPRLATHTAQGS